jgi:hypothetical protein
MFDFSQVYLAYWQRQQTKFAKIRRFWWFRWARPGNTMLKGVQIDNINRIFPGFVRRIK